MAGNSAFGPVLAGLRVLDLGHQPAAAMTGAFLADLGADVVVVEHPVRQSIRTMLPRDGEDSLWWKVLARGKRSITVDLSTTAGRDLFLQLAASFDVILENFRPGTLEKWGIGPDDLEKAGLEVLLVRISGYGQTGPSSAQPGFGTAAEAMSGFAHLNGEPDGPPTFPSTTLADGVSGVFAAFGLMSLLWQRAKGGVERRVEVVDVALFESLFRLIPTQVAAFDRLGVTPKRPGNKLTSHGVLRNLYVTSDARYFCVSAIGAAAMSRILEAAGEADFVQELALGALAAPVDQVIQFLDRCDAAISEWANQLTLDEVADALASTGAVFQPVYSMHEIAQDEQYWARADLIRVPDGPGQTLLMQGVVPKFGGRKHEVAFSGRGRGADNSAVYSDLLGLTLAELADLKAKGVI